jgi:hypothetical protein
MDSAQAMRTPSWICISKLNYSLGHQRKYLPIPPFRRSLRISGLFRRAQIGPMWAANATSEATRHRILVENPETLYGFAKSVHP